MKTIRTAIIMPEDLINKLHSNIPKGIRSEFCRASIGMALEAIEKHGSGFIGLMLSREVKFAISERGYQNLVASTKGSKEDENREPSN